MVWTGIHVSQNYIIGFRPRNGIIKENKVNHLKQKTTSLRVYFVISLYSFSNMFA